MSLIIDSSVLIHLSKIGQLQLIRNFGEILTTKEVYEETVKERRGKTGTSEIEEAFQDWIKVEKVNMERAARISEQEGIEVADASLIILAEKNKGIIVTNDLTLTNVAKSRSIECFWLTTLILKLIKMQKLQKEEAKKVLFDLIQSGMYLRNDVYSLLLKRVDEI